MLKMNQVDSFYGNSPVLQKVNFSVGEGELVSVLGRNGVGKTTLMRTILGLTDRSSGGLFFAGEEIGGLSTHARAKRGIAYVPQGRGILPKFTVRENILMGTFARKGKSRELPEQALEIFPYLKQNLHRRAGNLSGGQQQQLAIARALAADPKALLLDEPTEGIQPNIVEQIEQAILMLNREMKLTIILVEQNIPFVRRASNQFMVLEKGQVAAEGGIGELTDEVVHRHMTV
ncbi:urea ABC transporter ATP-binding subunit UrtE [Sedimenticola hydrogenitrophicus]|uniref:urea ABC transporter ATP-binding subunit UrtE n=1 Tax=Sedimenticola hydrogenitrophicus TaxID=2967975 RepID=UPI0021A2C5B7|nr:urea ABC transporter ATP-binding subunit UrtE [Sedimenticola hydrogenitrophicus]